MRSFQWLAVGAIAGVAASAVCFLLASQEGRGVVDRTARAGDRMWDGVRDLLHQFQGTGERVAGALDQLAQKTVEAGRAQGAQVGDAARRTAADMGLLTPPSA